MCTNLICTLLEFHTFFPGFDNISINHTLPFVRLIHAYQVMVKFTSIIVNNSPHPFGRVAFLLVKDAFKRELKFTEVYRTKKIENASLLHPPCSRLDLRSSLGVRLEPRTHVYPFSYHFTIKLISFFVDLATGGK